MENKHFCLLLYITINEYMYEDVDTGEPKKISKQTLCFMVLSYTII